MYQIFKSMLICKQKNMYIGKIVELYIFGKRVIAHTHKFRTTTSFKITERKKKSSEGPAPLEIQYNMFKPIQGKVTKI